VLETATPDTEMSMMKQEHMLPSAKSSV